MKAHIILALCLLVGMASFAQRHNRKTIDSKNQKPMLVGACNRCGMGTPPFSEWFDKEYTAYTLDTKALDMLQNQWRDVTITLVLGTWCGDSRREVPRFYKVLDYIKFKKKNLKVICVDRDKKAGKINIEGLNIQFVPTIIVYRGGAEMGRIIETPKESLEKDLYQFVGLAEGRGR